MALSFFYSITIMSVLITRESPKCTDKQGTRGHKDSRSVMNIHSSCTVLIRHYMKIIIVASLTTKGVVKVMSGAIFQIFPPYHLSLDPAL